MSVDGCSMDTKLPRVVVTGIGVISNIGVGHEAFSDALREGRCVVTPIEAFDTQGYPYAHATEVRDLGPLREQYDALVQHGGRSSAFSVLASREAVQDAGLDEDALQSANAGVVLGTTNGESQVIDAIVHGWMKEGAGSVDEQRWSQALAHRIAAAVAQEHALPGEVLMLATACAAGNYAIGHAMDIIQGGEAEVMICGGVDSVCRKTYSGFFRIGAITPDVCRPFDAGRQGILTGEGAAILVLESYEHAAARGARIYAEVLGYGTNCDANHIVAPNRDSIAECIRIAHQRAGIAPSDVDFISAHGTGTKINDITEVGAIRAVFGDQLPPITSIKSMIGHTMGAASAMGAIACVLGMQGEFIPPTVNFRSADPQCDIDCVPNVARPARSQITENHGFAFGGNNAIVILKNAPVAEPEEA
jgi:3-oxoacyl-[acyl-carrier-protein] synthase II